MNNPQNKINTCNNGTRQRQQPSAVVIVTSDSCFEDASKDESGAYVAERLKQSNLFSGVTNIILPDDRDEITRCLLKMLVKTTPSSAPALVITVGGTGLCPRDVTPDATSALYRKHCTGIVTALHLNGLRYSPFAALSRLTAGIVNETLIINFPGKLKACIECFSCLDPILGHALEQVYYDADSYNARHIQQQHQFRQQTDHSSVDKIPPASIIANDEENEKSSTPLKTVAHSQSLMDLSRLSKPKNSSILIKRSNQKNHHNQNGYRETPPSNSKSPLLSQHNDSDDNQSSSSTNPESLIQRLSLDKSNTKQLQKLQQIKSKVYYNANTRLRPATSVHSLFSEKTSNHELWHDTKSPNTTSTPLMKPTKSTLVAATIQTKPPATHSQFPLIEFPDALEIMGTLSYTLLEGTKHITLNSNEKILDLMGHVLAENLRSKKLVPARCVSTMDGYVVNIPTNYKTIITTIRCLRSPLVQSLEDFLVAQANPPTNPLFCYRVNTGGALPNENYAVVPIEKTGPIPSNGLVPLYEIKPGMYIRSAGSDMDATQCLEAGTIISPVELGLILTMGHKSVKVMNRPKIGILSTGDELVETITNDCNNVVDANGPLLLALFKTKGYDVVRLGIVRDEPEELLAKLNEGISRCDVLLITGGASMGTKDYVKDMIEQLGAIIHFGRVNMKPGKPACFSSILINGRRKFIFSLPGNPVSAYVTATVLVQPFLEHGFANHIREEKPLNVQSIGDLIKVQVEHIVDEETPYEFDGRTEFIRARISRVATQENKADICYHVTISIKQQSSRLLSLKDCDCFVIIEPEKKGSHLKVGQVYSALRIK